MRTESQIVDNTAPWVLAIPGSYFRLVESVGKCRVQLTKGGRITYDADDVEAGLWSMPVGGFDGVNITSKSGPQLVKVGISDGTAGYDRYTGTVNLALGTTVQNTGGVNVPASATTLVLAANASRKGIRFLHATAGGAVTYLGGAGVDLNNGALKLNAGDLWLEGDAPAAAWYAYADAGAVVLKVQELF